MLPPETISAQLYCGPGSSPMMTAAAAWDMTLTALCSSAVEHGSVILSMPWTGPSATAMRAAATRYQSWLISTAEHAAQTATLARAAASAFEAARAAAAHPLTIAANRAQLAALTATNILGQNTAAIAATEAQYAAMWAQDIAAMTAYSAASTQITAALPTFTAPAALATPPPLWTYLLGGQTIPQIWWTTVQSTLSSGPWQLAGEILSLFTVFWALGPDGPINQIFQQPQPTVTAPSPLPAPTLAREPLAVKASTGTGNTIGPRLRVPPSWGVPATKQSAARPIAPTVIAEQSQPFPLPFPLAFGSGVSTVPRRPVPEYGTTLTVMAKHPLGG